jgi:TetR/AcrR family transcriptional regulator
MNIKKPRVKDKEVRIRDIQDAAKKLFFSNGFQHTSMELIAKQAGISKGAVYLYFKNKEDLYLSLMAPVASEFEKRLGKWEEELDKGGKSGKEIIAGLFDVHINVYKFDPDGVRAIQAFLQGDFLRGMSPESADKFNKIALDNFAITRRILSKALKAGLIKKVNIFQISDIIFALFLGVVKLEENKKRITQKDHLRKTLKSGFAFIADALCTG